MTAKEILEVHRSDIEALCRRFGVSRLLLLGSALRADWDPSTSDIDFLAEFGLPPDGIDLFAQRFVFQEQLTRLLGREVDIVDWKAAKKPLFREAASKSATEWYAA